MKRVLTDECYQDSSGVRYSFDDLKNKLPAMIFLGPLHVDVCKQIAGLKGYEGELYEVYVNLLVKHSKTAKNITALLCLIKNNDVLVTKIDSKYAVKNLIENFIDSENIIFSCDELDGSPFFRAGILKKLFFKMVFHKVYRIFFRKKQFSGSLVRSWIEITESMYGNQYDKSLILIYPFYLNFLRHFRYIKRCFRSYNNVSLCGVPYKLRGWLRMALKPRDIDLNYVKFELDAYKLHGAELIRIAGPTLYTSDEFEAGSVVMAAEFRAKGGRVVNKAHGLSFGSPYLAYDEFTIYNTAQLNYYASNSPNTAYKIFPRINAGIADVMDVESSSPIILIFIEANFERLGMEYEANLEAESIQVVRDFALKKGIKSVIKAHPNRRESKYQDKAISCGVKLVKHLSELGVVNPIFITIASAAYYDFKQFGPFLFVNDGHSNLFDFYGEEVKSFPVVSLAAGLDDCIEAIS